MDEGIRPGLADQLVLADQLAGPFHKDCRNVEGSAADLNPPIAFQHQPPRTGRRYIRIQRQTHRFLQLRVIPAAPSRSRPRGEGLGEELQVLT